MIELLRRFLRPYRWRALVGILTKMVEVVLEVLTPLVVANMIDEGIARGDTQVVVRDGMLLAVFAVVSYVFTFACQRLAAQVSQGVGTDVRRVLFSRIMTLSQAEVDHFGSPSLVTRVTNDVNQVQLAVALGVRMLARWPLLATGSVIAACLIDAELGLVFVVCLPAITLVFAAVMRRSIPFYRELQARLDATSLIVRETLSGMRVIRALGQQDRERARSYDAVGEASEVAVGVGALAAYLNPATFLIMYGGVGVILYVGAGRVGANTLTTGEVMAFVGYMTQTLVSISYLANLVVVMMRASASSMRCLEVLDCASSITDDGNTEVDVAGNLRRNDPALRLSDVSFTYPGAANPSLSHVTLSLAAGATLGVIGGTGSGKSTLVRLLPRLFDASEGVVEVFGAGVAYYPLAQLRRLVSLVPQDVSLVSGTIRSNLSWRSEDASDEELLSALAVAQARDFVEALPEGLDAPVEAGGRNFSGGQRQRLTIARALVGSPSLIVLDDSSSALDFKTDASLRAALAQMRQTLTTVIVSQRVSAVMASDLILVLDHGRVAGLGRHEELLQDCALYAEIYQSQMGGREVDHG